MKNMNNDTIQKKRLTMTIAIPVYNEEQNISNILDSIFRQKQNNFYLEKIVIYNDASTDRTIDIIKQIQKRHLNINVVTYKKQKGKVYRINKCFKDNRSDIVVQLDADIGIVGDLFLENLIEPLLLDSRAQMVSAAQIVLRPGNFVGKIIYASFLMWDFVRLSIPDKDHVQNYYDSATAYRDDFAKKIFIPEEVTDGRLYIYLAAKEIGGFRYSEKAKLVYWSVSTLKDYMSLAGRAFGSSQPYLNKKYKRDVSVEYNIQRKYKIIGLVKSLYHQPLYTPIAIVFGYVLSQLTKHRPTRKTAMWEIATSTKKTITEKEIIAYE